MKYKKGDLVIAHVPVDSFTLQDGVCICKVLNNPTDHHGMVWISNINYYLPVFRRVSQVIPYFSCKLSRLVYNVED